MSAHRPSRSESCLVAGALAALFSLLLLALGLAGAALGVRYGVVPGPALHIELGPIHIIAQTNSYPNCNPQEARCVAESLELHRSVPDYYSLWIVTTQPVANGSGPEQYGGARVFAIQSGP